MISKIFKKVVGSRNDRILRGYQRNVAKTNALEPEYQALSDEALKAKTAEFRQRLQQGATLDDLLPEAFAAVREASKRTLGMRHFDVQLIGGMALHQGKVAEMRTGEGKTLSATLPVYLNALAGKGVHVVTVNDYLAERDAKWMTPVYEFLDLTVGINLTNMEHADKQRAYAADVTYGTNNEFGFDHLRDNMVFSLEERVQRELNYAIIDEVDSILIDEARTPLIISGQAEESSNLYTKIDKIIPHLKYQKMLEEQKEEDLPEDALGDYTLDEKNRQAFLTERGHQKIEKLLEKESILPVGTSLYDLSNITLMHYVYAALRAHTLFQRDVHYVVKNNEILIVDEHTGRLMPGRRWSDGLHQAVEAKEGVKIQLENQTLATITFQNYFRMYNKLSGMTGTADTEAFELQKIYGLEVVVIPTNKPMVRDDRADRIYLTQQDKYHAIMEEITKCMEKKQPVLVGTASIESSEILSNLLKQAKVKHEVLNAKQHEREAKIIAEAGRPAAVTIATNMAGRGTDIVLGGNLEVELAEHEDVSEELKIKIETDWKTRHEQVLIAGGLHVLATERNESRRIDNQLRGRSGRQGDPGSSQFYLSMEDNLMRIFASERMANMMRKLGVKEGDVIQSPFVSRAIENAQRRVESLNYDMRKQLLEYDDVANDQRKVIYAQRLELLQADDVSSTVNGIRDEAIGDFISIHVPPQSLEEQWDIPSLERALKEDFNLELNVQKWLDEDETMHEETLHQRILEEVSKHYQQKEEQYGSEAMRHMEKAILLQLLDSHWKDHLAAMDHLRQGIHLRGYAQKNPTQEFKRESFELFTEMMDGLKYEYVSTLNKVELIDEAELAARQAYKMPELTYHHAEFGGLPNPEGPEQAFEEDENVSQQPFKRNAPKVGRNDPCPCGSNKKYKQCHGSLE